MRLGVLELVCNALQVSLRTPMWRCSSASFRMCNDVCKEFTAARCHRQACLQTRQVPTPGSHPRRQEGWCSGKGGKCILTSRFVRLRSRHQRFQSPSVQAGEQSTRRLRRRPAAHACRQGQRACSASAPTSPAPVVDRPLFKVKECIQLAGKVSHDTSPCRSRPAWTAKCPPRVPLLFFKRQESLECRGPRIFPAPSTLVTWHLIQLDSNRWATS